MFNIPIDNNMDDNSFGTAVCKDEQEMEYDGRAVEFEFSSNFVSPSCWWYNLKHQFKIAAAINYKEQNYANLAALVLTELVVSTFFVMC